MGTASICQVEDLLNMKLCETLLKKKNSEGLANYVNEFIRHLLEEMKYLREELKPSSINIGVSIYNLKENITQESPKRKDCWNPSSNKLQIRVSLMVLIVYISVLKENNDDLRSFCYRVIPANDTSFAMTKDSR